MKGLSRSAAIAVVVAGIALLVVSLVVLVPAFLDGLDGPRFGVPGSHTLDLENGTWTIYEHTAVGDAGFRAASVRVSGVAPVEVWDHTFGTETITRGNRTYVGAVRFRITEAGAYDISVAGEPGTTGEVLVARPVSDFFRRWPWMLLTVASTVLIVVGGVLGASGATNRRVAREAGFPV